MKLKFYIEDLKVNWDMIKRIIYWTVFLIPLFLPCLLASQSLSYPSFHGKKYKAINPRASGSPFYQNKEHTGSLVWFGIKQDSVKFYYELVKDVLLVRQKIDKTTYLIELPRKHVDRFQISNIEFINFDGLSGGLSNSRNPSGYVTPILRTSDIEVYIKFEVEITSFANQPSHDAQLLNFVRYGDRWWRITSGSDLKRFASERGLNLRDHLKELPNVKHFTFADWVELWAKIKTEI